MSLSSLFFFPYLFFRIPPPKMQSIQFDFDPEAKWRYKNLGIIDCQLLVGVFIGDEIIYHNLLLNILLTVTQI